MSIQILRPKNDFVLTNKDRLVVSGRADESVVGVFGQCQATDGRGAVIKGKTFFYNLDRPGRSPLLPYRWALVIPVPDPGKYRLTVTGLTASCDPVPDGVTFTVKHSQHAAAGTHGTAKTARPPGLAIAPEVIIIGTDNNEDITDQKDDFAPGGFANLPLTSVTLIRETDNYSVPCYYSYETTSCLCWVAQFETIPKGKYTLTANDNGNNPDTRTGLTVTV